MRTADQPLPKLLVPGIALDGGGDLGHLGGAAGRVVDAAVACGGAEVVFDVGGKGAEAGQGVAVFLSLVPPGGGVVEPGAQVRQLFADGLAAAVVVRQQVFQGGGDGGLDLAGAGGALGESPGPPAAAR
jgi:hypothetical protein